MSHSSLATISVPASTNNYTQGRPNGGITKITVHHMAGVLSAERCGQIFQNPNRHGSSHYGIGLEGEIAVYVEEENTAWTDSDWESNIHSVTIENSNNQNGGNWSVSDATFDSLVKLCADIAKRNGLGKLEVGKNLTWHSMYASTSCPGDYLRSKMQELADKANAINGGEPSPAPTPQPTPSSDFKVGDTVTLKKWVDYNGTPLMQTREFYYISQINGDRAVLNADSVNGAVYCAANTNNLVKVGEEPAPAPAKKSNEEIADEVIRGDWGNGQERYDRLTAAGYDYAAIQAIVNEKCGGGAASIRIGDSVIVNGRGTASSNGSGAMTMPYTNQRMRVINIYNNRYGCNQYDQDGAITGWWTASQVRRV